MHTYLRYDENNYRVGIWLINPEGYHQFQALFTVPSLKQAMVAVNMLNGGTRIAVDALHLKEEK